MIFLISDVLGTGELNALSDAAQALEFSDGKLTAGASAAQVKSNLQAVASPALKAIKTMVERRLLDHPLIQSAALPEAVVRLTLSRYEAGMTYGNHTDNAVIDGRRTDLSFTLGLDSGAAHTGGDLVLVDTAGERAWAIQPGQLLLYPANTIHRVEPVTGGVRLVVIGWLTSRIRSAEQRAILFELQEAIAHERAHGRRGEQLNRLEHARQNLMRRWLDR